MKATSFISIRTNNGFKQVTVRGQKKGIYGCCCRVGVYSMMIDINMMPMINMFKENSKITIRRITTPALVLQHNTVVMFLSVTIIVCTSSLPYHCVTFFFDGGDDNRDVQVLGGERI